MVCSSCGSENEAGRKFCGECGSPLQLTCESCGSSNTPTTKFCGECGSRLPGAVPAGHAVQPVLDAAASPTPAAGAERRLVSVLFADLVGFTTLSEARDPEEVRELLSRYFETCRTLIARYGGMVEKFIGDAVMAVWGTPVATEDDAERAVRAALDLTAAVTELGAEVGAPELRARAGVLTGEAAVTVGAEGQGMVAGDLVNTASRIQSAAPPGAVYVGEVTRRATDATILYEEAGSHELKGKSEPLALWRAQRVVAGAGGAGKSAGLEAPFTGREVELRLIKERFHASADERKAHLVSVIGTAGIGKSRVAWEFDKYADGLVDLTWWHRGRCLAYGEGITYWALAEMVKMRARIAEDEEPSSALTKLRDTIEEHVPDAEERRWIEPRLAHLLGLEEATAVDREGLFAAWRLFFERLADTHPVVMVFEDVQWADQSLLDFIEYLLDWSRNSPIFILTLARPDLMDRFPNWGAGKRNFTSVYLEALAPEAMGRVLSGLVPGLPEDLHTQILERAEGVPLYAMETVRMLLDRGLLARAGNTYRPTGPIDTLEVPETLHALIAARLDGLDREERDLLQDGAVLGKTFTIPGIGALTGLSRERLDPLLSSLVRKEVLSLQADPRSPERGQYAFLQDLVRRVAYETLSKKERKAKHLAAATFITETWAAEEDEIIEVVASHYLLALAAAPDAPDAPEIKAKAREMLLRAGERAASLAANGEAQRYFDEATGLTDDPLRRAEVLERAGEMAWMAGRNDDARDRLNGAIAAFESEGATHPAARVSARLAEVDWATGRLQEAIEQLERALSVLSADEPDEDTAILFAQLGRFYTLSFDLERAKPHLETAIDMAESLGLPGVLSQALNSKGIIALYSGRLHEGLAFFRHALEIGLENDIPVAAFRGYNNVGETLGRRDRFEEAADYYGRALALTRKVGNRFWELSFVGEQMFVAWMLGDWDQVVELADLIPESEKPETGSAFLLGLFSVLLERGRTDEAERYVSMYEGTEESLSIEERCGYLACRAGLLRARGDAGGALSAGSAAFDLREQAGVGAQGVKVGFVHAVEAAFEAGELGAVDALLRSVDEITPGHMTPYLRAHRARFGARLEAMRGTLGTLTGLKEAAGLFREHGMRFWLAATLVEHGDLLQERGEVEVAAPLLSEARRIFEDLGAEPWLKRMDAAPSMQRATS